MALGVLRQQPAGGFQCPVIPDAGEDVEDLTLMSRGIADTVRGQ